MKKNFIIVLLLFLGAFLYQGCLKDNITTSPAFTANDSAELLFYLEDEGDYINSDQMPSIISADDVHSNTGNYLLLDIRAENQFAAGHVSEAINVQHADLINFLDSTESSTYNKIVLISQNGQSSAFYTCLLRLYGYNNVYSMNYGMAAWNSAFSDEWLNALQEDDSLFVLYSAFPSPKPPISPLPAIELEGQSISEKVKRRIYDVSRTEFEDNLIVSEGDCTIDYIKFIHNLGDYFSICYGIPILYKDFIAGIAHPDGTVLYDPPPNGSELRSTSALQSLPNNRTIVIYSTDGQLSAFAAAYLRVLGYNAKSILFGANTMFYYRLFGDANLINEAFSQSKIRDYSYVTGN